MLEVGKRAGKSKIAVHFYETGKRPIHFGTFIKLCSAIRVSPDWVIERWMRKDTFHVLDAERKKEYHGIIDDMITYGFSRELDNLIFYFRGLIDKEKQVRERIRQKRQIDEYFKDRTED